MILWMQYQRVSFLQGAFALTLRVQASSAVLSRERVRCRAAAPDLATVRAI
jgi:hypothetical protein